MVDYATIEQHIIASMADPEMRQLIDGCNAITERTHEEKVLAFSRMYGTKSGDEKHDRRKKLFQA